MQSPSAVSGAPRTPDRSRMFLGGALRIQRLEGSRPDGSLCPLNGAQRLRMVKIFSLTSWIRRFERWMERFGVTVSRHEEGEAAASRAVFSR
jgi:hypothetical protein